MNSKTSIDFISLSDLDWDDKPQELKRDRMRLKSPEFLLNKSRFKCIAKQECDKKIPFDCNLINVIKRIGSSSISAEVYLLNSGNFNFVGKILPITNEKSVSENENEIKIATKASELILNGESEYFPIVYGSSMCPDTKWDKKSKFYEDSSNYFLKQHLSDKLEVQLPTLKKQLTSNLKKDELIEVYNKITNLEKYKIHSHVLLSELAWGDLGQFLSLGKITEKIWDEIVEQILLGINDMQEKIGIVHNDLHEGNVLIYFMMEDDDLYLNCLIHDFGKSSFVSNWDKQARTADVEKILGILQDKSKFPSICNRIKKLKEIIVLHKDETPILPSLIQEWKSNKIYF